MVRQFVCRVEIYHTFSLLSCKMVFSSGSIPRILQAKSSRNSIIARTQARYSADAVTAERVYKPQFVPVNDRDHSFGAFMREAGTQTDNYSADLLGCHVTVLPANSSSILRHSTSAADVRTICVMVHVQLLRFDETELPRYLHRSTQTFSGQAMRFIINIKICTTTTACWMLRLLVNWAKFKKSKVCDNFLLLQKASSDFTVAAFMSISSFYVEIHPQITIVFY